VAWRRLSTIAALAQTDRNGRIPDARGRIPNGLIAALIRRSGTGTKRWAFFCSFARPEARAAARILPILNHKVWRDEYLTPIHRPLVRPG
jgi:hypothetical protein